MALDSTFRIALAAALALPSAALARGASLELVPPGRIGGDGSTPVLLHVVALDDSGAPAALGRLHATASAGVVTAIDPEEDGLYALSWTPPEAVEPTTVELSLDGRDPSGAAIQAAWPIQVQPALPRSMEVASTPPSLTLGDDHSATLSVTLQGPAAQPDAGAALLARASAGRVTNSTHLGGGRFSALYEPPEVVYPHVALLTFADRRAPGELYGYLPLSLLGRTDFPVTTTPGSSAILQVAGRDFGPYPVSADGRASIPIEVPPGLSRATLVTVVAGKSTRSPIDLKVPVTRRIALVPLPAALPADGTTSIPVRAAVVEPGGDPDPTAAVRFSSSAGGFSETVAEGRGIFRADWTTPLLQAPATATIDVALQGEPGIQSDTVELRLLPALPTALELRADPESLGPGAGGFEVFAHVSDAQGTGLAGAPPSFFARGAELAELRDLKAGDYQAVFRTSGGGPVELVGVAPGSPSPNPVSDLFVFPARPTLVPDGTDTTLVVVAAVDAWGQPVAGVKVQLRVDPEMGQVPDIVTTGPDGLGATTFTAGRSPGIGAIHARSGDVEGSGAVLLSKGGSSLRLPVSGTRAHRELASAWAGRAAGLVLQQGGRAAAAPALATAGIARIELRSQPTSAAPGGKVTISIQASDAGGSGLPGQRLDLLASQGRLGAIRDLGGGAYEAMLTLPPGASGQVKVIATGHEGELSGLLSIPIQSNEAVWGVASEPPQAPATAQAPAAAQAPATAQAERAPASEHPLRSPWLRARLGWVGGGYSYLQAPVGTYTDNPLWADPVALGGSAGPAAFEQGVQADLRAWLPSLDQLGAGATARFGTYSWAWPGTSEYLLDVIPELSVSALARYPFQEGGARFHAAVELGFRYSDFITYTRSTQGNAVDYAPLAVAGPLVGAELAVETGRGILASASLEEGFAALAPYVTSMDVDLGYVFDNGFLVSGSYGLDIRSVTLAAEPSLLEVGSVSDRSSLFLLGVGYQLE